MNGRFRKTARTCSFPHAQDGRLAAIHAGGLPAARAVRRRGRRYAAYTRHALWLRPAAALRAGVPVQQRPAPYRFLEEVFFPRGLVVWRRAGTWCRKRMRRTRIFIHKQQRCPLSSPLGLRTLHPLHPKPPMSVPCCAYERSVRCLRALRALPAQRHVRRRAGNALNDGDARNAHRVWGLGLRFLCFFRVVGNAGFCATPPCVSRATTLWLRTLSDAD